MIVPTLFIAGSSLSIESPNPGQKEAMTEYFLLKDAATSSSPLSVALLEWIYVLGTEVRIELCVYFALQICL